MSAKTHKLLSRIFGLLTWLVVPALLVLTIAAPFVCMNATIAVESFEKATSDRSGTAENDTCQYPGCEERAKYLFRRSLGEAKNPEDIALDIENKANFTIVTMPYDKKDSFDLHDTEDVYGVSYIGGGTFVVSKDKVETVEHVTIDKGVRYEAVISGYFCADHEATAVKTIKEEVREAFIGNDFWYFWGYGIGYFNYVIVIALFIGCYAYWWYLTQMCKPKK